MQCRKAWRQNMRRHRLGAGHAHDALKLRIASADLPLDPQGFDLDALCLAQDIVARQRQRVAVWGSVEKPCPKIGLQRREPTTHGRLCNPQIFRGRRQAAAPGDCQEEAEVIPIKHFWSHALLNT